MRSVALAAVVAAAVSLCVALLVNDGSEREVRTMAAEPSGEPSVRAIYEQASGSIVRVDARPPGVKIPSGRPTREDGVATGTGFVIDGRGSIVTNAHVVAGGSLVTVRFRDLDGRIEAKVVARDRGHDLALLRIDRDTDPLPLADSRSVRVGDPAIALGNPYGLNRTVTLGVVSGLDREIEAPDGSKIDDAVQTDAAINPGNSGGPLLDARGRVIGVMSQADAPGIGYGVSVDDVKKLRERG